MAFFRKSVDQENSSPADDVFLAPPSSETRSIIFFGLAFILVVIVGFVLWASLAPLDEGIPAPGTLSVESKRKTISHLTGGLVKEIRVKEGQLVEENAPLIKLDETAIRANYESALQTFFALRAAEDRLKAEQMNAKSIAFSAELQDKEHAGLAAQHMNNQVTLFNARRTNLANQVAVLSETSNTNLIESEGFQEQIKSVKDELTGMRELAKEGYAPKNQLLEMERQLAELNKNASRAKSAALEAKLRATQARSAYQQEVETSLADTRRDAANAKDRVIALKEDLLHTSINSPVKGYVTALAIHTISGVITPGMKIMDIVPSSDKLIYEVRVPSQLIDKVHPGLIADINLHNFPDSPKMVLEGKVTSVSADLITENNPNIPPYYLAMVEVTPSGQEKLGDRHLQAGMQADVVIKTGERTLLTYLLKPLLRRVNLSLREI